MFVEEKHLAQLRETGFFVLDSIMTAPQLSGLRADCDRLMAARETRMKSLGQQVDGLTQLDRRYFLDGHYGQSDSMMRFIHSDLLREIACKILGPDVYLFVEEFVVKAPFQGSAFSWHQDSGYIPYEHKTYLSCWCALDDMTEKNGALYMLPFGPSGAPEVLPHRYDAESGEDIGYDGPEPGVPVIIPAGSVVVFTSLALHRSGINVTDRPRRSYLVQFSMEPIMSEDGVRIRNVADPVVLKGVPVGIPAELVS